MQGWLRRRTARTTARARRPLVTRPSSTVVHSLRELAAPPNAPGRGPGWTPYPAAPVMPFGRPVRVGRSVIRC
jgi:hypothetical protein